VVFLLVYKIWYLGNCWTDLRQIHVESEFEGQSQRSKVMVTRDKKQHFFRPFRRPARGLCSL